MHAYIHNTDHAQHVAQTSCDMPHTAYHILHTAYHTSHTTPYNTTRHSTGMTNTWCEAVVSRQAQA